MVGVAKTNIEYFCWAVKACIWGHDNQQVNISSDLLFRTLCVR